MQELGKMTSKIIPKPMTSKPESKSETMQSLYHAKAKWVSNAKRYLIKDSQNPFHSSKYASLPYVQRCIDSAIKFDLILQNTFEYVEGQTVFVTKLVHLPSLQMEVSKIPVLLTKSDPQALSSAVTYYRRLICASMLDIVTVDSTDEKEFASYLFDDDDDGNSAMDNEDEGGSKPTSSKSGSKSPQNNGSDENKNPPKFKNEYERIKFKADRCGTLETLRAMWQEEKPKSQEAIDYFHTRKNQIEGK
jgi:hypothetical protein